ncbi:ergothioneine biosynthesis protein EgtB [Anabaena sp. CA = ATCC 33047]|uniref:ergothioneine biosynthesis protein EgtB n=1 Tax=Anabaena sp. (strain CA / ATCC 33047) TaxID=52271 RepID=UPI0008323B46|nr:ergothioneine biosynthesis protein EgtB [Anabaena sp. CA = ATCC 33047]
MISKLTKSSVKASIADALEECRHQTLTIFAGMDAATFCNQPHPDFSPVGWHLGHIAYIESLWVLEHIAGLPCLFPQYHKLYAADGLPKSQRVYLPQLEETLDYLEKIRNQVWQFLADADIEPQQRLWRFLIQHESQHCEIIRMVLQLGKIQQSQLFNQQFTVSSQQLGVTEMIEIAAGEFELGSNSIDALDNERPAHQVYLDTYWIDRYPVTCGQYRLFIEAGGYENPQWWSVAGWQWLQNEQGKQPLYWQTAASLDHHPVYGVSWYEAEAYSRFVGKRLPTEAEWEKAASWDAQANCRRTYPWGEEMPSSKYCNCDGLGGDRLYSDNIAQTTPVNAYPMGQSAYGLYDTLGNVWEWTGSWFAGYAGFESFPYTGYSQTYFDNQHRVLKGGSWASRPWVLRASFRNWYHPGVRQIFAGFRCAANAE